MAKYVILRDDVEIGSTTGTTDRDDGVSANTSYRYRRGVGPDRNRSAPSGPPNVTTPPIPPSPTSFTFAAAGDFGTTSRGRRA